MSLNDNDTHTQNTENALQTILSDVTQEMIDELVLGLCFEVHRSCQMGTLFLADSDPMSDRDYEIVDKIGYDVFGQAPTKKQFECVCPNCQRTLAASRFAPHLEKCMGMGRKSSRTASRRIANVNIKRDSDESGGEEDNDNDWNSQPDRKVKKLKKERNCNSPRSKSGKLKHKNGNSSGSHHHHSNNNNHNTGSSASSHNTVSSSSSGSLTILSNNSQEASASIYEGMSLEDRKSLLVHTCGVISEHTKKMCTRSIRCPQHTDDQRFKLRKFILNPGDHNLESDDVQIDIDGYEDGDSQSLRETLQWEASSNSSPADSTSTNNSTSSRKRNHKANSKTKGKKHHNNDHGGDAGHYDFT